MKTTEQVTQTPDLSIFAIFDSKANTYRDPISVASEWDILRDYERMCKDEKAQNADVVAHSEDFQLFSIGGYIKSTGTLLTWLPRHVASFHQVKASVLRKNPVKEVIDLKKAEQADALIKGIAQ